MAPDPLPPLGPLSADTRASWGDLVVLGLVALGLSLLSLLAFAALLTRFAS